MRLIIGSNIPILLCKIGQKYDHPMYNAMSMFRNVTRLPWAPKVRQKDIDQFLDISRSKFIGYTLTDDHESLAGLPQPIHEGIKTLKRVSDSE